jgi:hypothetical protein
MNTEAAHDDEKMDLDFLVSVIVTSIAVAVAIAVSQAFYLGSSLQR